MTVISRTQQNCCNYSSCNNSDTESLQLDSAAVSDNESVRGEPSTRNAVRRPLLSLSKLEDAVTIKKTAGKKKLRRYNNRCVLQTLAEEDEPELVVPNLIEPYKGPFTRLLEDDKALEFWNDFIEQSQEQQSLIMESLTQKPLKEVPNGELKQTPPFERISSKIKRTIKVRKNLAKELLKTSEKAMIDFFNDSPENLYVAVPSTSFERLLLHAVAQFHALKSISVMAGEKRKVEVRNCSSYWVPVIPYLSDVISNKEEQIL